MNVKIQLVTVFVLGIFIGGYVIWQYLDNKTGDAFMAAISAEPSSAGLLVAIAEEYESGNTEQARLSMYITLINNYKSLSDIANNPNLPKEIKENYHSSITQIREFLLKYPIKGCEGIDRVEDFGQCYHDK